ncbi:MAG TPA: metallophosphoesterase family protein [Verrucomicrobiota bacterium]|nr:serine/threonine protein phosphatase [Verrucomicrobiales bacterium]HRI12027.1 metallophosphoesterase family protein [Verrucomicrobiota bacterium]
MRTLAIGDIHGCYAAFETLLEAVGVTSDDSLILLGDYIDRGPESKAVVARVIKLLERGKVWALQGNHEVMILMARKNSREFQSWRCCGGEETLNSYHAEFHDDWRQSVPDDHWKFFEETRPWLETETHIFVHASVVPDADMVDQPEYVLYWDRFDPRLRHKSGKIVICGHTVQQSGEPALGARSVCIDTGIYLSKWLTCLDVDTGKYWQANERQAVRTGELSNLG